MKTTTVAITTTAKRKLSQLKQPGDSYSDLVDRILGERERIESLLETAEIASNPELMGKLQQSAEDMKADKLYGTKDLDWGDRKKTNIDRKELEEG